MLTHTTHAVGNKSVMMQALGFIAINSNSALGPDVLINQHPILVIA